MMAVVLIAMITVIPHNSMGLIALADTLLLAIIIVTIAIVLLQHIALWPFYQPTNDSYQLPLIPLLGNTLHWVDQSRRSLILITSGRHMVRHIGTSRV